MAASPVRAKSTSHREHPTIERARAHPSFVQVPRGTWIEGVQVWGPDGQEDSLDVAFEGLTIDAVPQDAVILIVSIRAMSGEDVTYAWHVVESEASG